jgi:hypothetical protein
MARGINESESVCDVIVGGAKLASTMAEEKASKPFFSLSIDRIKKFQHKHKQKHIFIEYLL